MNKKNNIILIGGGGHCKAVIDVVEAESKYHIEGVVDLPEKLNKDILNYKYIGIDSDIPQLVKSHPYFLITLGQIQTSELRINLFDAVINSGGTLPQIISPSAVVSDYTLIGEGSIIMHHALINADSKIGNNCIINNKAMIEHDAIIGNHCHISTGAIINGACQIGNKCFIGSNSVIVQGISVCDNSVVGAGSVVNKHIYEPGIYVGNPAKRIKP